MSRILVRSFRPSYATHTRPSTISSTALCLRSFSSTTRAKATDDDETSQSTSSLPTATPESTTSVPPNPNSSLSNLSDLLPSSPPAPSARTRPFRAKPRHPGGLNELARLLEINKTRAPRPFDYDSSSSNPLTRLTKDQSTPPHHLHVFSTKHNTHITLTRPSRDPVISVACGNIGLKKSARGSFDAAYNLAAYVMNRIKDQGLLREIERLELVLRGFGQGREATTKALMGQEGRGLRERVVRVTDATRLKFGGTRSPRPRRLG